MMAYLGKDNSFLEPDINSLLMKFVRETFIDPKVLDFETCLQGEFFCFLLCLKSK